MTGAVLDVYRENICARGRCTQTDAQLEWERCSNEEPETRTKENTQTGEMRYATRKRDEPGL